MLASSIGQVGVFYTFGAGNGVPLLSRFIRICFFARLISKCSSSAFSCVSHHLCGRNLALVPAVRLPPGQSAHSTHRCTSERGPYHISVLGSRPRTSTYPIRELVAWSRDVGPSQSLCGNSGQQARGNSTRSEVE